MLSNTATPKYYGLFRDAVLRGEIPVNTYISQEMNRIDALIANKSIYYDDEAVEGWIAFCEEELTLTDGSDFHMLDSFKLWGEQVFGWYYFIEKDVYVPDSSGRHGHYEKKLYKKRLINKQLIISGRGSAKSVYLTCIQAFFLCVDTSTTQQLTTAPTMRQADEVMAPLRTAIARHRGPLFSFLTEGSLQNTTGKRINRQKLCATKKGVENFLTNSLLEVRPWSIDKLQGSRAKVATLDEWLSGLTKEDPINAIAQGASKNDDWLIVATSSEGTVRNGCGDTIKMDMMSILKGDYIDIHTSIFYYRLDDIREVSMPSMWVKANPNLGYTVSYEAYQQDVEKAEKSPAARNDILAKRFGIPTEGFTYFFSYEETLTHGKKQYWRMPCSMGIDLSQGDDFCAFTFLFPLGRDQYGIKVRSYITSLTYNNLPRALHEKYTDFIKEGSLIIMEGTTLDLDEVYDDLIQFIDKNEYDIVCVGYDPYNAKDFMRRWCMEHGEYGVEIVRQGSRTESVPLGEIKTLAEQRLLFFDEELMKFTLGNAVVKEDTNGNRKLIKFRRSEKIDNVSALLDAYVAFKSNRDAFAS